MDTLVTLTGKITYVLFHNDTNYYTVAKFHVIDGDHREIIITGIFTEIETDAVYTLHGNYVEHPKYGFQFKVETFETPLPDEKDGIIRYLSSDRFPSIGKKKAETIVLALGNDCLTQIKNDPEILRTIPKLKDKEIEIIQKGLQEDDQGLQSLIQFLNVHGLSTRSLSKIYQSYGKEALNVLKENPYQVCEEIDGFGFYSADKLGMALGFQKDDPKRVHAYLITLVNDECMKSGNTFIFEDELQHLFEKKTIGYDIDFEDALSDCIMSHSLIEEDNKVYSITQYNAEVQISTFLSHFPYQTLNKIDRYLYKDYLISLQESLGITYDETQLEALNTFFEEPFLILTGGPGTGKTTVVKAMVSLFKMLYPQLEVQCVAPTGRAAKRLSEITDCKSSTIHSLLQFNLESNEFKKNEDEPLTCDLLIIDEFSMVDNYLFSSLLKACKGVRKICIIGDEDQLPSVSPGSVLRDLIQSDCFPLIRLQHIYRQKEGSDVISLAHDIRNNDIDLNRYHEDVSFFETNEENIKNAIIRIVEGALDKGYTLEDIQVLSPMYKGSGGIDVLNNALQEKFNPRDPYKNDVKSGYITFREGDKVLQLKNQPDDEVFNGDIGEIIEIDPSNQSEDKKTTIVCDFQGMIVEYKPENFQNIALAYCISVHKSQGSEYPIVIIPFQKQHTIMLTRKLIYTAITRSKKSLVMVGSIDVLKKGCVNVERVVRETTLSQKVQSSFKNDDLF